MNGKGSFRRPENRKAIEANWPFGNKCLSCDGSGIHYEDHGMGLREALGCQDCRGTGKRNGQ